MIDTWKICNDIIQNNLATNGKILNFCEPMVKPMFFRLKTEIHCWDLVNRWSILNFWPTFKHTFDALRLWKDLFRLVYICRSRFFFSSRWRNPVGNVKSRFFGKKSITIRYIHTKLGLLLKGNLCKDIKR